MERVTGSKGLAVAALVSLIIHGGILLTYAFVFKNTGTSTNDEPIKVALILPSELEKPVQPPLSSIKKDQARFGKDRENTPVQTDLTKERAEAPSQVGTLAAKPGSEATTADTPQAKDLAVRDVASGSPQEQNLRPSPAIELAPAPAGVLALLPAAGPTGKATGSGINSQGSPKVATYGGEMSLPGYAKLGTTSSGTMTLAAPRYNENALPAYPLPARRRGYAGVVLLSVEVLADGRVGRLEMKKTSGYDLLDKSAQETVRGWKFSPGKKMGAPVTMWVDVPVRFELN